MLLYDLTAEPIRRGVSFVRNRPHSAEVAGREQRMDSPLGHQFADKTKRPSGEVDGLDLHNATDHR